MEHKKIFSVGDYEVAEFGVKEWIQDNVGQKKPLGPKAPKEIFGPPRSAAPKAAGGQGATTRKAHIRRIGGKAAMVGQSILKAGKNTAGKLGTLAGQGVGAAASYGGKGAEVIAKNKVASGIAAGVGIAGAAGGYLAARKKRKRR